ncbi:MAG: aspartyl protease family protein [Verrucomicrobia bacterium]|nr:aspartyl protease family protein [Verrucomicrobiota bacterium]
MTKDRGQKTEDGGLGTDVRRRHPVFGLPSSVLRPLKSIRRPGAFFRPLSSVLCLLLLTGCSIFPFRREPPRPGRTKLSSPLVILPAETMGNYLLLQAKWDRYGPYRFLIDTGSSITLITPALAKRYPGRDAFLPTGPRVRVAGADGTVAELPAASLRRLELGDARFEDVPVLVYDCAPLSAHLGVKIDGVLGFPLFRETRLTLDYPGSRVVLQPAGTIAPTPGTTVAFDDARKTPLIRVQLGDRNLVALIDSGSDAVFSLNPVALEPQFAFGPRAGATVGTIAGDRRQRIGRLAEPLAIAGNLFQRPVVDLTDELSAIGGGMLKHFVVTFDQEHDRVTFHRDSHEPILSPPCRSAGVSFSKTPAYWKVAGVIPDSPANAAGIRPGDLVTRIDGEPVARWDFRRYERLIATAGEIAFTFLNGASESEPKPVKIFDLVP